MNISSLITHHIHEAGRRLDDGNELLKLLSKPNNPIHKKITFETESGKKTVDAFRVQHNNLLGPYKGGLRFHQDVSIEEFSTFSYLMTLKTALIHLPLGGGKGGIQIDPKKLSEEELENLSRAFIRAFADDIGQDKDIPAPDMNTNPQVMAWMLDEYEKIVGRHEPGVITGKPIILGGSQGREQATGYAGAQITDLLVKKLKKQPRDMTVAIQGFGNVGYFIAKRLSQMGYHIVALSDSKGAITRNGHRGGFDIETVLDCKINQGYIAGCYCVGGVCDTRYGKVITNEELLELDVDILVPAAQGDVIHEGNVKNIKAPIIVEMANNPITKEADDMLTKRKNTYVIPDILANAGGVTTSYFEWVQNRMGYYWEKKEVLEKLEEKMKSAFDETWNATLEHKIPLRTAAYYEALSHLHKAYKLKGK